MLERNPRWSRMLAAGIAVEIVSLIGLTLVSSRLKAAEAGGSATAPVVMEMNAVTLELVCRDGATEGEFHPIRCANARSNHLGRQSAVPCRPDRLLGTARRPRPGENRPIAPKAIRRHSNRPPPSRSWPRSSRPTGLGGRRDPGDRHARGQGRHPLAGRRLRHAAELPRRQDRRPAIARGNPFRRWRRATTIIRPPPAAATAPCGWPMSPTSAAANRTWPPPPAAISARFVPTGNGDQIRLVKFDGQAVVRADARHRTAAGSLEAYRDGRRGGPRMDRLEPERRRQLGHLPPQLRSGPEPVVADRTGHFRPGLRYQRRLHDRLEGQRVVGMAGPPREAFSNLPDRRRCRRPADRRDREAGQPLGPGDRRRRQGQCLRGLGQLRERQLRRLPAAIPQRRSRNRSFPSARSRPSRPGRASPSIARTACGSPTRWAGRIGARILAAWFPNRRRLPTPMPRTARPD